MNFQEFVATRQEVQSLTRATDGISDLPGWIYCGGSLWIEDFDGRTLTTTYGSDYYESDNFEEMERQLYEMALSDGFFN